MVSPNIVVNSSASTVPVISRTQKIILNPANSSVSVINAGPMGPRGLTGPPDAGGVLTVDGQIMTRAFGALAPITRVNLAADPAFTAGLAAHVAAADPHPVYMTSAEDAAVMAAHVAAADPHPVYMTAAEGNAAYLTPAAGDAAYINVGGDTMTGRLILSLGASETMRFVTDAAYISFYNAAQSLRRGYIQGNASPGILIASESGPLGLNGVGGLSLSSFIINGYTASISTLVNRIVLADANGYIHTNYFNCTADNAASSAQSAVAGRDASTTYIRWYSTARIQRWEANSGQNSWSVCGMSVMPTVGVACISFHTGGAPEIGSNAGFGNNIYVRDANWAGSSATVQAAAFNVESSKIWKKNINRWPLKNAGAAVESALDLVMKLNPISFQLAARDVELPSERRTKAWLRLNELKAKKGELNYELPLHDCRIHECRGTSETPCTRHHNHTKERLGMTAEEVFQVIPQACQVGLELEPVSIDYGQLTVVALQAIKELVDQNEELKARIYVLEGERE